MPLQDKFNQTAPRFTFEGIPIVDVMDFFRQVMSIDIEVDWAALEAIGVDRNAPVVVESWQVPYRKALEMVLRSVGGREPLACAVKGDKVVVSTRRALHVPSPAEKKPAAELPAQEFRAVPLGEVLKRLSEASDVKIEPNWEALKAEGLTAQTPVTLKNEKPTLGPLLTALLRAAGESPLPGAAAPTATYIVLDDAVRVSTPQDLIRQIRLARPPSAAVARGHNQPLPKLDFYNMAFGDVVQFIRVVSIMPVFVDWHALAAAGIGPTAPVTMRARDVSVADGLLLILRSAADGKAELDYIVDADVIEISTRADIIRRHGGP